MSPTRLFLKIRHTSFIFSSFKYLNCSFVTNRFFLKNQKYLFKKLIRIAQKNMNDSNKSNILSPPETIRGMQMLDKEKIQKTIIIPRIKIGNASISKIMPNVKKYLLKLDNLKPLQTNENDKYVMLNPCFIKKWDDIDENDRQNLNSIGIDSTCFDTINYDLKYENWKADELLKFILPIDHNSVAGFSKIGHIIHLNLRDYALEYKSIIGQIFLDKIHGVRTVVNKLDKIDSTYRNFEMEILCGDSDMNVQVKENRCAFEFDFSTVYWNPRLSTEHERIVNKLKPGDVLYDVFAGVGPFSIPAAKKKCFVLANDLNPESFKWLNRNTKTNKLKTEYIQTFNKDGNDFIQNELKTDLIKRISNRTNTIHITMNLPALATEFLKSFNALVPTLIDNVDLNYPIVHVYCFAKGENPVEIARDLVETGLGYKLFDNFIEIFNVRKVSSYKEMMRVSFRLTKEILMGKKRKTDIKNQEDECELKKLCHGKEQKQGENEKCVQSSGGEKPENQTES